jgi:hypothetical protein
MRGPFDGTPLERFHAPDDAWRILPLPNDFRIKSSARLEISRARVRPQRDPAGS